MIESANEGEGESIHNSIRLLTGMARTARKRAFENRQMDKWES
jgi:hypothetical protein